ncbi:MAG: YfcE family phosphodiesterase [Patescibacteria group bacterium]|nr:YfcE family phosphodiesterase [Patescibacteria group bacterium]MDD5715570.1 YfcE family phosphodiesterase [Patescibacteria group bacterium]
MKIAIVSDSHDNLPNIEKTLTFITNEHVETLIHCGDVCAPGTLKFFSDHFAGPIHLCFGNVDGDKYNMARLAYEECKNVKIHGDIGELQIGEMRIAFVHYPYMAKALAAEAAHDIVFYGHNHKPWEEMVGSTKLVNPGNLANIFYQPTFALYDTETGALALKMLNTL